MHARALRTRPARAPANTTDHDTPPPRAAPAATCGNADKTRRSPRAHTTAAANPATTAPAPRAATTHAHAGSPSRRDQRRTRELPRPRLHTRDTAIVARHQIPSRLLAGSCAAPLPARSIFTAQNLNSGILPTGSISSIVRRFADASRKWNGMKHVPGVSRCDEPRLQLDRPAAARRRARTSPPCDRPSRAASSGLQVHVGLGLDRVQRERAARHRARVPVLEQAAGVEHERVLLVGQLLRRQPLGRHEVRLAVRRSRSARRTAPRCRRSAPGRGSG